MKAWLLLLLPLLLAPLLTAEEYALRLTDGTTIRSASLPVQDGPLYIFRGLEGRAYSVKRKDVREIVPLALPPAPAHPIEPRQAVAKSPRRYTNDDLQYWQLTEQQWRAKEQRAHERERGAKATEPLSQGSYRDTYGRDEAYWRPRARLVLDEVKRTRLEHERLSQEYAEAVRHFGEWADIEGISLNSYVYTPPLYVMSLKEKLRKAKEALRLAEAQLSGLEEEARKAEALPGWLR